MKIILKVIQEIFILDKRNHRIYALWNHKIDLLFSRADGDIKIPQHLWYHEDRFNILADKFGTKQAKRFKHVSDDLTTIICQQQIIQTLPWMEYMLMQMPQPRYLRYYNIAWVQDNS